MTITRRGFLQALAAAPAAPLVANLLEGQGIAQNAAEASVATVYGVDAYGQTFEAMPIIDEQAVTMQMLMDARVNKNWLKDSVNTFLSENPFTPPENAWLA